MKGKLKRIMALALGVVTCFMSIAPNVVYADTGEPDEVTMDLNTILIDTVNENLSSIYERFEEEGIEITKVGESTGDESYIRDGSWVSGNIDKDTGELKSNDSGFGPLGQELLRGSEFSIGDNTQYGYITKGTEMRYNSWSTFEYTYSDGTTAFCIEPSKTSPGSGNYTSYRIYPTDEQRKWFIAALYYGYNGPGYNDENGLYNALYSDDPTKNLTDYSFQITHMILSYIWDYIAWVDSGRPNPDSNGHMPLDQTDAFYGSNVGAMGIADELMWNLRNSVPENYEAFMVDTGGNQTLAYGWTEPQGWLYLTKESGNKSLTDGNSNYDLSGATYWIYDAPNKDANYYDYFFMTDSTGRGYRAERKNNVNQFVLDYKGDKIDWISLEPGVYYVQEWDTPKGYERDTTFYTVIITDQGYTYVNGTDSHATVKEKPKDDPLRISIYKQDADGNPVSNLGGTTLEGAEYTVYYFEDTSITNANVGSLDLGTAKRKWTFKTSYDTSRNEYIAAFDDEHWVSGDALYYDADNNPAYPIGSYVISETKAPAGYTIAGSTFTDGGTTVTNNRMVVHITDNGAGDTTVSSGNTIIQKEVSIKGGVELTKNDADTYSTTPQGNAVLKGAEYTIVNNTGGTVTVNGTQYANGAAIMTLTTDENGHVGTARKVLPGGAYYIYETKTPDGYLINGVHHDFTITADDQYITIGNATDPVIRGGVKINKRDAELADPNTPQGSASLAGAVYKITNRSSKAVVVNGTSYAPDTVVARLTTDAQGLAQSAANLLPYGDYDIQEETPSNGYKLNSTVIPFSIRENGVIVDLSAEDTTEQVIRGGVEVTKLDAETLQEVAQGDASLAGAKYSIVSENSNSVVVSGVTYQNGDTVATIVTDENGSAASGQILPKGKYYLYETEAPEGYLLNVTPIHFEIVNDGDIFRTEQEATDPVIRGGVMINKRDAELTNPNTAQGTASLRGAVYTITNRSEESVLVNGTSYAPGEVVERITTDAQGQAQTAADLLPYGDYEIQEETPSNGYKLNPAVIPFSIRENGVIVDLSAEDTTEQVIRGGVKINKRDAELTDPDTPQGNASLEGAVYKITNRSAKAVVVNGTSYAPGTVVARINTDAQGQAQSAANLLPYGDYDIQEETPSSGYKLNPAAIPFTIRENGVIVDLSQEDTTEQVIRGGVKINKRDAELTNPDTPQGQATLQGAVYKVTNRSAEAVVVDGTCYNPGDVVARLTTDEQGHAQSAANLLPYGDYEIQEETPSSGYKLNNTVIAFSIRENGVIVDLTEKDTTEEVIRGGVELVKVDAESLQPVAQADASLEGAKYAIVSENNNPVVVNGVPYFNGATVATLETDAHGAAATGKILPRGKYYIYETEPSEGYLLNPNKIHFEITTEGQVFRTEQKATEQVKKQAFQLIKISSNGTNTEAPVVESAEFTVKLASEVERVGWSTARTYDVLTTDENGYAKSIELAYGKYRVRETRVPENMSAVQDFYVTITEDSRTPQAWRVFNDTPYEVYLKIVKRDAATGETILLPNVSFKIWDKDNQKYVTQKLGNKKVDTFTTDETGVTETALKIGGGHYEVREITAPEGYLLNTQGVDIEISNMIPTQIEIDEDGDEVVVVDVYDEAVTGSVSITKHGEILEEVKRAGILDKIAAFFTGADTDNLDFTYQDAPLKGCKFILVADEDIYTPDHQLDENGERRIATYDGVELFAGAVVATVTTDENGEALIEELPLGAYHVEEVATIDGFIRNTTVDSFNLEYAGETVAVVYHDSDWENQRVTAKVELQKTGTKSGDAVEGAVYGLFNREDITLSDGTVLLPADTLIEKQTTDENGCIKFTADLPLNKFYVKELSSPEGFVPDTTEYDVDLSYKDDATPVVEVRLDVQDDEITLQISKQDITTGKELPGAHLQILKEDGSIYEEWDSTTEPHIISCIPAGDYVLHEDLAPVGFATASDIHFTVEETGEVQKVTMKDDVTKVEISKQDITTGKELPGAHLQILKEDGSIYAEWDSTDKPYYIEKMPTGKYVLHESLSPIGYATASDIAFEVKDTGEVQKVVMKDDVIKVEISKQDITTGKELPGAHLQIIKEDGSIYAEWDSTDKPHYIEKMPTGKYVLHESLSPVGFATASDITFEVKGTGEIQRVVMKDDVTKVEISKQDITTGKELPGAHLQIINADGSIYAEWDSTDKPYYIEKMPTGAYVLHEVSSPDGYEIASDVAFEVKDTGEIQKVVMYDERTPDVPKTGDNSPLGMIAGVCIAALASISALLCAIIHRKKSRRVTKSN